MFYLTELGNRLKEAREAKGMSLDDLQEATKIQKRYLIGIEEGNYEMMPGKFYVRAFIKQYCEAVGLDPEGVFEEYKNDVPAVHHDELPEQLSRVQSRKTISPGTSKFMELFPRILAAVLVIGVCILIWVLISKYVNNSDEKTKKNENKTSQSVDYNENKNSPLKKNDQKKGTGEKQQDKNTKTEKPAAEKPVQALTKTSISGKYTTYTLKNAESFKLKVASKGQTWVGVKNGTGKLFFQGILKKNESKDIDFSNEAEAVIIIGNASDTEISVNDEKLEYAISPSKMVTQTITIQFDKSK
ncbi:helix-turn-helix domain-containing protein [Actinomycetes bacterium NPDC127524]